MNEPLNSPTTHSMPIEVELWMRTAKNSNRMKYAAFFRDLIRSIPPESARRLLRVRLQQDPSLKGMEIPDATVEAVYYNLLP